MEHRSYVLAGGGPRGDGGASGELPVERLPGRRWRGPRPTIVTSTTPGRCSASTPTSSILGAWDEPTYLAALGLGGGAPAEGDLLDRIDGTRFRPLAGQGGVQALPARPARGLPRPRPPAGRVLPRCWEFRRSGSSPPPTPPTAATSAPPPSGSSRSARSCAANWGSATFTVLLVGRLVEGYKGVGDPDRRLWPARPRRHRDHPADRRRRPGGEPPTARRPPAKGSADVRFLGTLDHEALCRAYAAADVLALPSRSEPWGFVLNEGMEFGLPLVVSEAVGAGPDLVEEGGNGFVVPVGDAGALAAALREPGRRPGAAAADGRGVAAPRRALHPRGLGGRRAGGDRGRRPSTSLRRG